MKIRAALILCPALLAGALLAGCAHARHAPTAQAAVSGSVGNPSARRTWFRHVPPGQSLFEATAQKPELVALPAPPEQMVAANNPPPLPAAAATAPMPTIETEKVADDFTLGNLCMQQGRYEDAIKAYESALKDDPTFAEAWNNLAIAYQNSGQEDKAMAAFRKYKMVALH
jgi:tetratricopeptide (TPR) repeat protein